MTRNRRVRPFVAATTIAVPVGFIARVDPNKAGHYPTCPVRMLLGIDCPGCGSLRTIHALLHGEFVVALDRNALLVLAIPVVVTGIARWAVEEPPSVVNRWRYGPWALIALLATWTGAAQYPTTTIDSTSR